MCPHCERANTTVGEWYAMLGLVAAVVDEWSESRQQAFKSLSAARAAMGRIGRAVETYLRERSL